MVFVYYVDVIVFGSDDVIFYGGGGEMKVCCMYFGDIK